MWHNAKLHKAPFLCLWVCMSEVMYVCACVSPKFIAKLSFLSHSIKDIETTVSKLAVHLFVSFYSWVG